jgi:outer membrane lipoprotein carrier protein
MTQKIKVSRIAKTATKALLILTSLYLPQSFAQNDITPQASTSHQSPITSQVNPVTKSLLIKKLKKIDFFSADFNQRVLDATGHELQKGSGTLVVSKPNLVRWHTKTPNESLIVSDGQTLWFYNPFIEQVTAYPLLSTIANTPILLLTTQDPLLWDNYSVSQTAENNFLITANDTNNQVKTLALAFKGSQLDRFVILDATGQTSHFSLSAFNTANAPDLTLFTFTLPEGVSLDDQR